MTAWSEAVSMMYCVSCSNYLDSCICTGRDESLKRLAFDPQGQVAFKWCRSCDKHYSRCKCEWPKFFFICGGKEIPITEVN